jgi:hypothetical protein
LRVELRPESRSPLEDDSTGIATQFHWPTTLSVKVSPLEPREILDNTQRTKPGAGWALANRTTFASYGPFHIREAHSEPSLQPGCGQTRS